MVYVSERQCDRCRRREHVGYKLDKDKMTDTGMPDGWAHRPAVADVFPPRKWEEIEKYPEHGVPTSGTLDLCPDCTKSYDAVEACIESRRRIAHRQAIWKSRGVEPTNPQGSDQFRTTQPWGTSDAQRKKRRAEVIARTLEADESGELHKWVEGNGYAKGEREGLVYELLVTADKLAWASITPEARAALVKAMGNKIEVLQTSDVFTIRPLPKDAKIVHP